MDFIIQGLINALTLQNIMFMFLGVAAGILFGSLPGLTATMGVALMLPLTFGMVPETGMFLLLGVYCGGTYGGSITAILIKTPGTPASAATAEDGYALAREGRAGEALRMATFASTAAGLFSALILLFVAPQLAQFALKFGPTEFFALAVFGLAMISSVSGKSLLKGMIMGALGMLVATIGLDPIGAVPRLTFNNDNLMGGIALIPALIGLFAISEILTRSQAAHEVVKERNAYVDTKLPFRKAISYWKTILKSSAIGTFIGAIPGTGAAIASFLSYNEAKRVAKDKDQYGKGSLDGIAASEAGNNGVTGSTLIPLLTLGIPGDTVTAIMLGALMMQGLTPGPQLFVNYAGIVYTIMVGLLIVNLIMYIQGSLATRLFVHITRIPVNVLLPILLTLCFIGAYAVNNTLFDAKLMMMFGLIGFIMPKFGYPVTPMLLGIILGPIAENSLRQALILSDGSWLVFFTRPISAIFIFLAIASFLAPIVKPYLTRMFRRKGNA